MALRTTRFLATILATTRLSEGMGRGSVVPGSESVTPASDIVCVRNTPARSIVATDSIPGGIGPFPLKSNVPHTLPLPSMSVIGFWTVTGTGRLLRKCSSAVPLWKLTESSPGRDPSRGSNAIVA